MSSDLFKRLGRLPACCVLGPLGWIEDTLLPDYELQYNPIFIIGPPRSGTTLLLQLITFTLTTCYFTNLAIRLRVQGISRPPVVLSAWLAKTLQLVDRRNETFRSRYGHTRGWGNPSDSVMIWQHWFAASHHSTAVDQLSPDRQRKLYQAVAGTERIFGRPFVDKATDNSVRICALSEVFPRALFIQCIRAPLAVAQSIYVGRSGEVRRGRPPSNTTFTKPKEFSLIRHKSLVEQSCELLYFIEQNIATEKETVSPDRFLTVHYKEVCLNPQAEVSRILSFIRYHGTPVEQVRPTPQKFRFSHVRRVDAETYQTIIDHLERLYGYEIEKLDEPS
jgi:hypothetical protein